jgi:hypothetical protein
MVPINKILKGAVVRVITAKTLLMVLADHHECETLSKTNKTFWKQGQVDKVIKIPVMDLSTGTIDVIECLIDNETVSWLELIAEASSDK